MIGIAVSFYDKFEDFGILVDIIRNNWEEEYYIVACSNHPDADTRLEKYDIDKAVQGSQIQYRSDMAPERKQLNITCRILDQFQKACQPAVAEGCEKVMHLKADAWPLDEERVLELAREMDDRGKKVAIRGLSPTYRKPKYWLGSLMDQFLLFNADYAESISLLDYDPLDMMPHTNIHTALSMLLIGRVGMSNIWHYSNFEDDQHWDGKSTIQPFTSVRPAIFNPTWGYVHVAVDEFPDDWGRNLQAIYLKENGITEGKYIQKLISNQSLEKDELFQKLAEVEERQDRKLKRLGFKPVTLGRKFQHKQNILDSSAKQKIGMIIKNVGKESYYQLVNILLPSRFEDRRYPLDIRRRSLYRDAEWPDQELHEVYEQQVRPEDFPEENRSFWFEDYR